MIRFFQRQKSKKGFTIIELIVVIAIIAILAAIILPNITGDREKINSARSTAKDFYSAVQMVMSKYSFYDGDLSTEYAGNKDLGLMRHYPMMGGNYPYDNGAGISDHKYPAATSMYIMMRVRNSTIETTGVVTRAHGARETSSPGFFELLKRANIDRNTEFGRLFSGEIGDWMSFRDGYYYARVDFVPPTNADKTINKDLINAETVKVAWAAYTRSELPAASGSASAFTNANLYFGTDYKLNSGEICGTCAPLRSGTIVGMAGTKLE